MKLFLSKIFKFGLFSLSGYIIILLISAHLLPHYYLPNLNYNIGNKGHLRSRISEVNRLDSVDILILGSSHAYRGIDTRIISPLNKSTFNLGSSAQTPLQTEVMAHRFLHKLNPELIIYEVYPGNFASDGIESTLDLVANSKLDLSLTRLALRQHSPKTFNSIIYGLFLKTLYITDKSKEEELIISNSTYIPGGFVEDSFRTFKFMKYDDQYWDFNPNQFDAFQRTLTRIKDTGSECLLVYSPITSSRYESYTNQPQFDSIMNASGTYIDFNPLVELDDSLHFSDSHHLNQNGVEIYNRKLVEVLSSIDFSE